jgi:hypothetical protein
MRVGIIGPLCRDEVIVNGKSFWHTGSPVYYCSEAISSLGGETILYASFGDGEKWDFRYKELHHIKAEGTMQYVDDFDSSNPDLRIQRAKIPRNVITAKDLEGIGSLDAIILGSLYNNNIEIDAVTSLKGKAPITLVAQGLIRYLNDDLIVWDHPENVFSVLPYVDYTVVDDEEATFITKQNSLDGQVDEFLKHGAKNVVITKGSSGSVIGTEKGIIHIPAYTPREIISPNGCGDTFAAAFIFQVCQGSSLYDAGKFAAMAATMKLEGKGPLIHSAGDIENRLTALGR